MLGYVWIQRLVKFTKYEGRIEAERLNFILWESIFLTAEDLAVPDEYGYGAGLFCLGVDREIS